MSVGAGSIKRAAGAVNAANNAAASNVIASPDDAVLSDVMASLDAIGLAGGADVDRKEEKSTQERTESIIQKAESRLAARKAAEGKDRKSVV